ncbi:MAG TPA: hypothetical protein VKG38_17920 [Solirubrobacteraceae bacterium]|nr:hypothetical protein [Solirubrobacteraceae bacterium]
MGVIRRQWLPGRSTDADEDRANAVHRLREDGARRWRETAAARELEGSLISLAGLLGAVVTDPQEIPVGRLDDVIVHWTAASAYPAVTGIVVGTGKSEVFIGTRWVEMSAPATVRLRDSALYARGAQRRPGEVSLAHDVLDRQVIDANGVDMVRPADVYLAVVRGSLELVAIEVGVRALLRRLGPRRLRRRVRPGRVIDWASIRSFAPARERGVQRRGRRSELAGAAGVGLRLGVAAADLKALHPSEVKDALRAAEGEPGGETP